jgi:hypothetical protein
MHDIASVGGVASYLIVDVAVSKVRVVQYTQNGIHLTIVEC